MSGVKPEDLLQIIGEQVVRIRYLEQHIAELQAQKAGAKDESIPDRNS